MPSSSLEAVQVLLDRAVAHGKAGRSAEMEADLLEAARQLDAIGEDRHPLRAFAAHSLRTLYLGQQRYGEALEAVRQELAILESHFGSDGRHLAGPLDALAYCQYRLRQWEPAASNLERAVALYRREGPGGELKAARALTDLGKCFHRLQRLSEAEKRYREAVALFTQHGSRDTESIDAHYHLGTVLAATGRTAEAEPVLERALAFFEQLPGPHFPLRGMLLSELVRVAEALGRSAEAETYARQAVTLAETEAPERHPALADALRDLGRTLSAQGRLDEALPVLERSLPLTERTHGARSPFLAACFHNLAGAYLAAGRVDDAAAHEERALALYEAHAEGAGPALANCLRCLAMVRERQGRPTEARALAARAATMVAPADSGPSGVLRIPIPPDEAP